MSACVSSYNYTNDMESVYAKLADANQLIGSRKTELSTVYDILKEMDAIISGLIVPDYVLSKPEPEPEPVPEPVAEVEKAKRKPKSFIHRGPQAKHKPVIEDGPKKFFKLYEAAQAKKEDAAEPEPVPEPKETQAEKEKRIEEWEIKYEAARAKEAAKKLKVLVVDRKKETAEEKEKRIEELKIKYEAYEAKKEAKKLKVPKVKAPVCLVNPSEDPAVILPPPKEKKENPWVKFLQDYSAEYNIPYQQAMHSPNAKELYREWKIKMVPII